MAPEPVGIEAVRRDRNIYFKLYMRYLVMYWFLSICAAGTAISTAIKTAYDSVHNSVPTGQAAANTQTAAIPREFDGWILGLTVSTVVATVLLTTIQPHETSDRFRFGQLLIEKALVRYDTRLGEKTQADVDALIEAYNHAQDMLQGGIPQLAQKVTDAIKP
jgi:hypothetical protein